MIGKKGKKLVGGNLKFFVFGKLIVFEFFIMFLILFLVGLGYEREKESGFEVVRILVLCLDLISLEIMLCL